MVNNMAEITAKDFVGKTLFEIAELLEKHLYSVKQWGKTR